MKKCLRKCKMSELEKLIPEYFNLTHEDIIKGLRKRKLKKIKNNLVLLVLHQLQVEKWSTSEILEATFHIDLEYTHKTQGRYEWRSYKFIGNSSKEQISDIGSDLRRAIRKKKSDALVLTKLEDGVIWISVVRKNLKMIGIYKQPFYIALSESGKYFFIRSVPKDDTLEMLKETLGFAKYKSIKLSGKCVKSLLKLLIRSETADMSKRPVYEGGKAVENEYGFDMTQKKSYEDFYSKCVDDDDVHIQHYKVSALDCPWMGPGPENLKRMKFNSCLMLSGDVYRIMKQLPISGVLKPPFPEFYVNFSVNGKNRVNAVPRTSEWRLRN